MKKINLLFFLLLIFLNGYSQKVVVIEGDTLVSLQLQDIRIINTVFFENQSYKNQLQISDSIISFQRDEIEDLREISVRKENIISSQSDVIVEANKVIEKQSKEIDKEKKKKKWYGGVGFLTGGVLVALILL